MSYGSKPKIANGASGQTVWLKRKEVKKKNGDIKEVFQGSVDMGGGKMLKISIPGELYTVQSDKGEELLPCYASKWKSENTQRQQPRKNAW